MDIAKFRNLMGRQAGAVTIIAVGPPGQRTGLTATAMCSLSDTPPMLLICVNRKASAHTPIKASRCFSVNILASDQEELAKRFSSKKLEGEARFDALDWHQLATGAPVLRGALVGIDCALAAEHEFETHSVFIGLIKDGHVREDAEPLIYYRGIFKTLRQD
jgi:flavin reductase (DIM6/NTAB) family NADH-FMN oxidoreductase RutF